MHCTKSVRVRDFFWPIFSSIWTECNDLLCKLRVQSEYGKIWIRKNSAFGHFSCSDPHNVKVKGCLLQCWMKYLAKSKKKQGKWNRTRKLWYLLWCSFWPLLWKVSFWKRNCALHYGSIFIFRLSWHTWFVKILKSFSNSWGKNYFTCIYSNTY